jgi:hypothetical protein
MDIPTLNENFGRFFERKESSGQFERSCFATAADTNQGETLALLQTKAQVFHRFELLKRFAQILTIECAFGL